MNFHGASDSGALRSQNSCVHTTLSPRTPDADSDFSIPCYCSVRGCLSCMTQQRINNRRKNLLCMSLIVPTTLQQVKSCYRRSIT